MIESDGETDAESTRGERPTVVGVAGPSDAGKTGLIERLVEAFADEGARVATVKSIHHSIEPDDPGTDTHRHRTAGAAATMGITPRHAFEIAPIDGGADDRDGGEGDRGRGVVDRDGDADADPVDARKRAALRAAVRRFAAAGYDPILVEGFSEVPIPTIRVGDPDETAVAGDEIAAGDDPLPAILDAIRAADPAVLPGRPGRTERDRHSRPMTDHTPDDEGEPDRTTDGDRIDGGPPGVETRDAPPTEDPNRNYRPIDLAETGKGALPRNHPALEPDGPGPQPGGAGGGGGPSNGADLPDAERIQNRMVAEIRSIDTPRGDPVSAEVLTDLTVADGVVTATLDAGGLDPSVAAAVGEQLRGVGLAIEGVDHVRIESPERSRIEGELSPEGVDHVLAVAGAKGGAGKSTVTLALARALRDAGLDVGVFDADFQAPDLTEYLGASDPVVSTPTGRPSPAYANGMRIVSIDLVSGDRPTAWRGAMTHDALADLLGEAVWGELDVLLVDLPPGVGDVAHTVFSRVPVDGAVVVTTPSDVSVRNVTRTVGLLDAHEVPVAAVVANKVRDGDADGGPTDARFPTDRGDRDPTDLVDEANGDPPLVSLPLDDALRDPAGVDLDDLDGATAAGLAALRDAVTAHVERVAPDVPEGAVDISGLPDRLREQQALIEAGAAPDGPRPLLVDRGDDRVGDALGGEFDVAVEPVDDDRELIRVAEGTA